MTNDVQGDMPQPVIDAAVALLKVDEGYRQFVYIDTRGYETIGYGFNLKEGLSQQECALILELRVQVLDAQLGQIPWYSNLDQIRAAAILDLAYNLGVAGLLQFHNMIQALQAKSWKQASSELLSSQYATQVPNRCYRLAQILLTGQLPAAP